MCLLFVPSFAAAQDVVDFAASLIGRPYVWGAEGPRAFDCSGLTQYVYQQFGIELPRRAISQSRVGDPVGRRLQRGDLLFFSDNSRESPVTHVGIYEGSGWMIEASKRYGKVRRSELNDAYWADRLLFGRRITSDLAIGDATEDDIRSATQPAAESSGEPGSHRQTPSGCPGDSEDRRGAPPTPSTLKR